MEQKKLQQGNPPAGPAGELKFQPRMLPFCVDTQTLK